MQLLTLIAGFPACTPAEETQKTIAKIAPVVAFILLTVAMLLFSRMITRSKLSKTLKIVLGVLLILLAVPVCIGIPLLLAFVLSPWCH